MTGVVFGQDDMNALRALIENSHPSVGVIWSVDVRPTDIDDSTTQPANNM